MTTEFGDLEWERVSFPPPPEDVRIFVLAIRDSAWLDSLPKNVTVSFQTYREKGKQVLGEMVKTRPTSTLCEELDFLATIAAFNGNDQAYGIVASWYSGEILCPHCNESIVGEDIASF